MGPKLFRRKGTSVWWCWVRGKRRSTRCRDHKAAGLAAAEFERRASDPAYHAAASTTVAAGLGALLDERRARGRAAATLSILTDKSRHLCRLLGGETPLALLTGQEVDRYIERRRTEGAHPHTIYKELGALRGALRLAARRGLFNRDASSVLPERFSPEYRARERCLTPAEARALLAALPTERAAHVAWIIGTGSRDSEAARAERGDLDARRMVVRIRGTKTDEADAEIPVLSLTEPVLRFALERAPGGANGPLFAAWPNIRRDIRAACKRAGIERCSPNDLRRTLATWLRQAGVPADVARRVMRHSTTKMLDQVYARLSTEDVARLAEQQTALAPYKFSTAGEAAVSNVRRLPGKSAVRPRLSKPLGSGSSPLGRADFPRLATDAPSTASTESADVPAKYSTALEELRADLREMLGGWSDIESAVAAMGRAEVGR